MKRSYRAGLMLRTAARAAFTLVELLVVMAIIAILFGLTTAGVMQYLRKVPDVTTRNDIGQLSNSLETFKTKFKLYPPSAIFLANDPAAYSGNNAQAPFAFRQQSLRYLTSMWPRIFSNGQPVDWTGAGANSSYATILEGDQCLVFFLRGINGTGFSTNGINPTQLGGNRVGPFFEFSPSRLAVIQTHTVGDNVIFPSYIDAYSIGAIQGSPYLYFSSGLTRNGYGSDCPTFMPAPYSKPKANVADPLQFYNPDTFQIISAGRNLQFGPGGTWTPANAAVIGVAGFDDLSNFHGEMMGVNN